MGHQSLTNWTSEKVTKSRENTSKIEPRAIKAREGTKYLVMYLIRIFLYRYHPAGIRAIPEKTDNSGHARENVTGMILRLERKKNSPTCKKYAAINKYVGLFFNFIATITQLMPIIMKKKETAM